MFIYIYIWISNIGEKQNLDIIEINKDIEKENLKFNPDEFIDDNKNSNLKKDFYRNIDNTNTKLKKSKNNFDHDNKGNDNHSNDKKRKNIIDHNTVSKKKQKNRFIAASNSYSTQNKKFFYDNDDIHDNYDGNIYFDEKLENEKFEKTEKNEKFEKNDRNSKIENNENRRDIVILPCDLTEYGSAAYIMREMKKLAIDEKVGYIWYMYIYINSHMYRYFNMSVYR